LKINPFLRARHPDVRHAVAHHANLTVEELADDAAVFAALRQWKNKF
jgi:hypothetical protein